MEVSIKLLIFAAALLKLRHSFLNGHGRLRTAFFNFKFNIMAQRVTFYIDGFNFYYGLRRTKRTEPQWGDYYWIDMVKLCEGFLGEDQVVETLMTKRIKQTYKKPFHSIHFLIFLKMFIVLSGFLALK